MGFLSGLFGGGQKSQTMNSSPWAPQQPYLKDVFSQANDLYKSGQIGGVAEFNPWQIQGQNSALNFANNMQPTLGNMNNSLNFALNAPNINSNPFLQSYINSAVRPVMQNFQENVLPSIGRNAMMTGGYGGSRQGIAEGIAARGLGDTIGDISTRMNNNAYNTGLNTMMQGMSLAPQVAQMNMMPSNIMQQIGGQRQAYEQQQIDNPYQNLMKFKNAVGGSYGGTQSQTVPTSGPFGSLLGAGVGGWLGGMPGASLGMSLGGLF